MFCTSLLFFPICSFSLISCLRCISSSEAGVKRLKTSEPTGGSRGAILLLSRLSVRGVNIMWTGHHHHTCYLVFIDGNQEEKAQYFHQWGSQLTWSKRFNDLGKFGYTSWAPLLALWFSFYLMSTPALHTVVLQSLSLCLLSQSLNDFLIQCLLFIINQIQCFVVYTSYSSFLTLVPCTNLNPPPLWLSADMIVCLP